MFPSNVDCVFDDALVSISEISDWRDRRVHWLYRGGLGTKHMIVAFNFGLETFSEISVLDSVAEWEIVEQLYWEFWVESFE